MTLLKFPLDGTDGATATTGNTGCTMLSLNGNPAMLAAGAAAQGSTGLRLVGGGTAAAAAQWNLNAANNTAAYSFFFRVPAGLPSAAVSFFTVFNTAAARVVDLISYRTTGIVQLIDAGNTGATLLTAAQAPAGALLRVEAQLTVGASTTTGTWTVKVYNTSGVQVGTTASSTTANLGASQQSYIRAQLSSTVAYTLDVDSVQLNDGSSSPIGLMATVNQPPTVSAGPDQTVTAAGTVTLRGSATDPDGTIASVQWTALSSPGAAPTITNPTSSTATFTAATPGVYVFQFAGTDNSGATSTDTCVVYFPAASVTVASEGENSGAWSGAFTDLADTSDSTFVQSSGSGTNTFRLAPITPNTSLVVTVRASQTGTGSALTVTLLQGATTIVAWTLSSLTSTPTDYPLALTSTQVAAITNWNALDVRFS